MSEVSILCGLGNPGSAYARTRHNLGAETLDVLAKRHRLAWHRGTGAVLAGRWKYATREILLIKPLTFMNASGESLACCGQIEPASLLVVCDDINLPLGRLRIRRSGGSGGHLGIESVIRQLESEEFPRLRMGIGSPPLGIDWSEYVLSPFLDDERETVERMIDTAVEAIETVLRSGLEAAMQQCNRLDPV